MSNLKIDLRKYTVEEVTPEIANRINGALENVLKNVANLFDLLYNSFIIMLHGYERWDAERLCASRNG